MPEDYERLQKKIEDGLEAVRELKKLAAEEDRRKRPKLRLIKGGLLVGALWAGVEWFRSYKRIAVALAATGITATGAVIAEQPHSPGADPPAQAISQPAEPRTSVPPRPTPRPVAPTPPRRTSPPRTTQPPMRARPPTESVAKPVVPAAPPEAVTTAPPRTQAPPKPTARPPTKPVKPPAKTPTKSPKPSVPIVSLPVTPTVTPTVETPNDECVTITVLGICILG